MSRRGVYQAEELLRERVSALVANILRILAEDANFGRPTLLREQLEAVLKAYDALNELGGNPRLRMSKTLQNRQRCAISHDLFYEHEVVRQSLRVVACELEGRAYTTRTYEAFRDALDHVVTVASK